MLALAFVCFLVAAGIAPDNTSGRVIASIATPLTSDGEGDRLNSGPIHYRAHRSHACGGVIVCSD